MFARTLFVSLAISVMIPTAAVAQEDGVAIATLDPLESIITEFSSGTAIPGATVVNDAEDAAIVSQFQVLVNFGRDPAYGSEDLDPVFSGLTSDEPPELVSLEEYFPDTSGFRSLPPLAPDIQGEQGIDLSAMFAGWRAFGEEGPIEGPIRIFEPFRAVWGIELAEPFDDACAGTFSVGRAWEGSSITTGPDPLFTEEALSNWFQGTHGALAGEASRIVQLSCAGGGDGIVRALRMKEGAVIRPFGPTDTIALVKDQFVVFLSPVRIHDGDLDQFFFASPPGSEAVEVSGADAEVSLLIPNPYEDSPNRVTIVPAAARESAFTDDATGRSLVHQPGGPTAVRAQSSSEFVCPRAGEFFIGDFVPGAVTTGFLREASAYTSFTFELDVTSLEFTVPGGSRFQIDLNFSDSSVDTLFIPPGLSESSTQACTTSGTFLVNDGSPAIFAGVASSTDGSATTGDTSDGTGGAPTEPADPTPISADPTPISADDDGGSGFPWWLGALGLAAAGGGAYAYTRTRKDSDPTTTPSPDDPPTPDDESLTDLMFGSALEEFAREDATDTTHLEDAAWKSALHIEAEAQTVYLGEFESMMDRTADASVRFAKAFDLFREHFVRIMSGSGELQRLMGHWSEARGEAQKVDIGFAVIQLYKGVGSLGLKAYKWIKTPKAAEIVAKAVTLTDDAALAIDGVVDSTGIAVDAEILRQVLPLAEEARVSLQSVFARFSSWDDGVEELMKLAARSRGWHGINMHTEAVVGRLLVNGRAAVRSTGSFSPADVAQLRAWVDGVPDFWNKLLTSGDMLEDGAVLFYNADDVRFLKGLLECEGDVGSLTSLLGPARTIATKVVGGDVAIAGIQATGTALQTADSVNTLMFGPGPLGELDSIDGFVDSFGVTGELNKGFGTAVLNELWNLFNSPAETGGKLSMTWDAIEAYEEFLKGYGSDLLGLGANLQEALDALDDMRGATSDAAAPDGVMANAGRRLRAAAADLEETYESASDEWKQANGGALRERLDHINQKMADVDAAIDALAAQEVRLTSMYGWIDGLRKNPDGTLRGVTKLFNPELVTRMAAADLALRAMVGDAASGGGGLPASAPEGEAPEPLDPFADYDPDAPIEDGDDFFDGDPYDGRDPFEGIESFGTN